MKIILLSVLLQAVALAGTHADEVVLPNQTNVAWWCGVVTHGNAMPMTNGYAANLTANNYGNQVQPLLLSSRGDVVWCAEPINFAMKNDTLRVASKSDMVEHTRGGSTLREACKLAREKYFPPSGKLPDEALFAHPQYNTWIELMYDQNQRDVLKYAHAIVANGFEPGVLMIDDNWQEDYGKWTFHPGRFPDRFKVMVWVCPFVSPDSDVYRALAKQQAFLKDKTGQPAMVRWWNGASALLDFTRPAAMEWFKGRLDVLHNEYGVDGFKFDAGDATFYPGLTAAKDVNPNEHSRLFGQFGLLFPLNEYRAMWQMGGQPLAERLRDKCHNWADLHKLVPDILQQGLIGYSFTCPDLIGGGEFTSFLDGAKIDQELIVRSAFCHSLMPMMQFSVAPWRVLDVEHLAACKQATVLRAKYLPTILKLAQHAAKTGEPIVRSMEYVFPHQGYAAIKDQFLLGDDILVAPELEKGVKERAVQIPPGTWANSQGKRITGPATITASAKLDELPIFERK
ncbi:MAG: glycoside hydrolase family 31 protein [Kiritimatiellaeota bacterium]|nr:glycoside hydrolase family 31 protein [Kiritimatiellota bacterium]